MSTVLYVGGLGRSGSTLLDRMLGRLDDVWSVGELVHLWERGLKENNRCGCGRCFADCPFWRRVGEVAFGGWDTLDADEVLALRRPQVAGDRLLVARHHRPPQRLAVRLLAAPLAHRVALGRVLHLDHFGAEVAEQLAAERPGQQLSELDHPQVVQGQRHGRPPIIVARAL